MPCGRSGTSGNNAHVRRNPNTNFSTRGQNWDLVRKVYESQNGMLCETFGQ